MTCKVERYTEGESVGQIKSMIFSCDHPGCDKHPSQEEIIAANGLTAMGWECPGGKHFCPAHRSKPMLHDKVDQIVSIHPSSPEYELKVMLAHAYIAGAAAMHGHGQDVTEVAFDYATKTINRKEET